MSPPPLPDHLVNLTLQYLLPPAGPLPLHLISKQSLQRHHFLNIDPTDAESYFCWPSSGSSQNATSVIRALELLAGNVDLLEKQGHDIKYNTDGEGENSARVQVGDDVQIVFHWQDAEEIGSGGGESGWRYHDAKLSANSHSPGRSSISTDLAQDEALSDELTRSSTPSSDAYWDNYGGSKYSP